MEKLLLTEKKFPGNILRDIKKVESILRSYGARKIILYGSLARRDYRGDSDIDICFEGIHSNKYFHTVAECLMKTHTRVSVLDFGDIKGYLRERILKEGKILYERK